MQVLHVMGHQYQTVPHGEGLIFLDCQHPGVGGPYELLFDVSLGDIPINDVLDQVELAGIDRSVFLTHLAGI